jgi:hypothetical protein
MSALRLGESLDMVRRCRRLLSLDAAADDEEEEEKV